MIDKEKLCGVVEDFVVTDPELFVVAIDVLPSNRINVVIDRDRGGVDIDTCVALSKQIGDHFDRDVEDYELEVASAGLTSPLVMTRQYRKFVDKPLEVLLRTGVKEIGNLKSVGEESFVLEVIRMLVPEGGKRKKATPVELEIHYKDVNKAVYHLVV